MLFLQRASAELAMQKNALLAVCPSVRPSVWHTLVLCQKWLKLRSCGLHRRINHQHSIFMVNFTAKFQREHPKWRRRMRRIGKICNFQAISRRISKMVQDRTEVRLLWMTKRKLHKRFRLVPKSSTLDDLERPIPINTIAEIAHHKNLNEDRPILYQQRKCRSLTLVSGNF